MPLQAGGLHSRVCAGLIHVTVASLSTSLSFHLVLALPLILFLPKVSAPSFVAHLLFVRCCCCYVSFPFRPEFSYISMASFTFGVSSNAPFTYKITITRTMVYFTKITSQPTGTEKLLFHHAEVIIYYINYFSLEASYGFAHVSQVAVSYVFWTVYCNKAPRSR